MRCRLSSTGQHRNVFNSSLSFFRSLSIGLGGGLLFTSVFAACTPATPTAQSVAVTLAPTQAAVVLATAIPTTERPPTETPTLTPSLTPTLTPTFTVTPTLTWTPTLTLTASETPIPSPTPTLAPVEFFALARPIASSGVDYIDRSYPYASTGQGNWEVHHGVEFQNPRGTPVLAPAPGTVYYAGDDSTNLFGPYLSYYGNVVVITHDFKSPDGLPVFTLYGHLDKLEVETGQRIDTGHQIGSVGATGIALGPHLHFEVRVGEPGDFGATRNPELWLHPYRTYGVIVGRVANSAGDLLPEVALQVRRAGRSAVYRYVWSYADNGLINSDNLWGENFTLGDVPAGDYDVIISDRNGKTHFKQTVSVVADRITWVDAVIDQP